VDTEEQIGPSWFLTVANNGIGRIQLTRYPVLSVVGGQYSPSTAFPPSWTTIPANKFSPEMVAPGMLGTTTAGASNLGSAALLIAPGYI